MPTLHKQFTLDVTVEQFLKACSDTELQELDLLLPRYLRDVKPERKETLDIKIPKLNSHE